MSLSFSLTSMEYLTGKVFGLVPGICVDHSFFPLPVLPSNDSNCKTARFIPACALMLAHARKEDDLSNSDSARALFLRSPRINSAIRMLKVINSGAITDINCLVNAFSKESNLKFRRSISWIGGNTPFSADSFVFCEPSFTEQLISDLRIFLENSHNPIVSALVCYLHIVIVHPLQDGNGRLARFAAAWSVYKDTGNIVFACALIRAMALRTPSPPRVNAQSRIVATDLVAPMMEAWSETLEKTSTICMDVKNIKAVQPLHRISCREIDEKGFLETGVFNKYDISAKEVEKISKKMFIKPINLGDKYVDFGII